MLSYLCLQIIDIIMSNPWLKSFAACGCYVIYLYVALTFLTLFATVSFFTVEFKVSLSAFFPKEAKINTYWNLMNSFRFYFYINGSFPSIKGSEQIRPRILNFVYNRLSLEVCNRSLFITALWPCSRIDVDRWLMLTCAIGTKWTKNSKLLQ